MPVAIDSLKPRLPPEFVAVGEEAADAAARQAAVDVVRRTRAAVADAGEADLVQAVLLTLRHDTSF